MNRLLVSSACVLIFAAGAAAEVKSGLQPGDRAGAYNVKDITGPNKGKSLCYR